MYGSLDISTSALVAHRQWMEVISSNLANKNAIYNAQGEYEPFRRKIAVFAHGDPAGTGNTSLGNGRMGSPRGVHLTKIMDDPAPLQPKYEPGHPDADDEGYVYYPNVNSTVEQMNALVAARHYEANIVAAQATKTMLRDSLSLIA